MEHATWATWASWAQTPMHPIPPAERNELSIAIVGVREARDVSAHAGVVHTSRWTVCGAGVGQP